MQQDKLKDIQFNFISEILRGLSHDLKNDIAVIKESAGFIEDIITFRKNDLASFADKQLDTINVIYDSVKQIDTKLKALNKFARGLPSDFSEFDLFNCIEEFLAIISKFLRRHKIKILFTNHEQILIYNNPLCIQYVINKIILCFIDCFKYDFFINISLESHNNKAVIIFTPNLIKETTLEVVLPLYPAIEKEIIDVAALEIISKDNNSAITVLIPLKII
jgi:hypothetical protein